MLIIGSFMCHFDIFSWCLIYSVLNFSSVQFETCQLHNILWKINNSQTSGSWTQNICKRQKHFYLILKITKHWLKAIDQSYQIRRLMIIKAYHVQPNHYYYYYNYLFQLHLIWVDFLGTDWFTLGSSSWGKIKKYINKKQTTSPLTCAALYQCPPPQPFISLTTNLCSWSRQPHFPSMADYWGLSSYLVTVH